MIAVVDYDMGNVRSVQRAFAAVGAPSVVTRDHDQIRSADHIVLPGVGAFGVAMQRLEAAGLVGLLGELVLEDGVPFLGICVGMQLICRDSEEHGHHEGLGWVEASVRRLDPEGARLRVPHVGWNDVRAVEGSQLLPEDGTFYFVHSYAVELDDADDAVGTCDHGRPFTAAIERDNVWATQFHPEKSQRAGLEILRRFAVPAPIPAGVA